MYCHSRRVPDTPHLRGVPRHVVGGGKPLPSRATIAKLAEPQEQRTAQTAGRSALGLAVQTVTPQLAEELGLPVRAGVLVSGVEDGSPAAGAGGPPGGVMTQLDRDRKSGG